MIDPQSKGKKIVMRNADFLQIPLYASGIIKNRHITIPTVLESFPEPA